MRPKLFLLVFAVAAAAILLADVASRAWLGEARGTPAHTFVVAFVVGALAAWVVSESGARLLSESLRDLRRAARAMELDRTVRSRIRGPDEVGALGESLDRLADDLHRSAAGLAAERERLESILETMADAVVVTDAEDRIVLANGALRAVLGTSGPLVGRQILEAVRSAELADLVRAARTSDTAQSDELDVLGLSPRRVRVRVAPLAGGKGKGVVAVVSDVTDLRRLESMRRDFVANVSHELRTPVAAIRAAAETLDGGALDDASVARDFLGIIVRHSERLHQLVEDLLDLSRIEAQKLELAPERLAIGPLLDDVRALYAPAALRHDASIEIAPCPADLDVVADRRALEQILSNLVDNAIKYGGAGGHVRLAARRDAGGAAIDVKDDGPGIPAQHLPRLFERFYRVDRGRSREVGGTGLGLSIVKHLAEALGGQVTVDSDAGRGATFTVHVPAAPPAGSEDAPSPPQRNEDARIAHQP